VTWKKEGQTNEAGAIWKVEKRTKQGCNPALKGLEQKKKSRRGSSESVVPLFRSWVERRPQKSLWGGSRQSKKAAKETHQVRVSLSKTTYVWPKEKKKRGERKG